MGLDPSPPPLGDSNVCYIPCDYSISNVCKKINLRSQDTLEIESFVHKGFFGSLTPKQTHIYRKFWENRLCENKGSDTHLKCLLAHPCVLQCVCCSVLKCVEVCRVAVCCCMLQCVAVCCSVLQCVAVCAVCCSVLQCVAVCCSVLQCVAVCCSVLQCVGARHSKDTVQDHLCCSVVQHATLCCSVLQRVAKALVQNEPTDLLGIKISATNLTV